MNIKTIKRKLIRLLYTLIPINLSYKLRRIITRNYIYDTGYNNQIIIIKDNKKLPVAALFEYIEQFHIKISGDNNILKIELSPQMKIHLRAQILGNSGCIEIDKQGYCKLNIYFGSGSNTICKIGKLFCCNGLIINLGDSGQCFIGDDCMISNEIEISTTDNHTIFDKINKKIINKQKRPLIIGNHCWIGRHVRILKNAQIPNNTIIGMSSIVTKKFEEENTIIAGYPAKVIKHNVEWDGAPICSFEESMKL